MILEPKFEITVSDFEYEGEISDAWSFAENTSKAKVTIKVTNREGQRFTNPYAIAFTDESDVERGNSGNFGAEKRIYSFKGRYFPTAKIINLGTMNIQI